MKSLLSESNLLSEEVSSLSTRKTLENVKSKGSVQPARPAKPLSLLALNAPTSAKCLVTNSHLARHARWARIRNLRSPKVFKVRREVEAKQHIQRGWEKKQGIKAEGRQASCFLHIFTSPLHFYLVFSLVLSSMLMED